jgi:adenosylhomocysteine nucleosidase
MMLFVAAMASEVGAIIREHAPEQHLLITGVGKVNAASQLSAYLATHHVSQIVNLGFAGATEPYQVGDLVIIDDAKYHDFDLSMFGYAQGQVPGMPKTFLSDQNVKELVIKTLKKVKSGHLLTGDVFMTEKRQGSYLVDMEGAALYHVAYLHKVPIVSIKVVSDIIGSTNHLEQYQKFEAEEGANILLQVYRFIQEVKS